MSAPAIRCQGLTRYYGRTCVVDRLDLTIATGSVVGLLGRNGAGKTTTIRMILGLLAPTRGLVEVLGMPAARLGAAERARIGHLAETHPVHEWMTVAEHGRCCSAGHPRWSASLYQAAISHFGLEPRQHLRHLSRGQRAGVCLAGVLAADPDLLVLDDPALGLDPLGRQDLLEALVYLVRRQGRTVLFSSHHLADVERVADRIAIMDQGRLRAWCAPERFRQAIHRTVLGFAGSPPPGDDVPGLLQRRRGVRELDLIVLDEAFSTDVLARRLGAERVREIPLSLDETFNAYVAPRRDRAALLAGVLPEGES